MELSHARINQGKDHSTGDSSGVRFKCKALLSSVSNFWGSKCLCSNRGLGEALLIPPTTSTTVGFYEDQPGCSSENMLEEGRWKANDQLVAYHKNPGVE